MSIDCECGNILPKGAIYCGARLSYIRDIRGLSALYQRLEVAILPRSLNINAAQTMWGTKGGQGEELLTNVP